MTLVVAGILRRHGRILICQRGRGRHAGQWEFPGGKCEPGETEPDALKRELREELGIESDIGRQLARVRHQYPETGELEIAFFAVAAFRGEPRDLATPPLFASLVWAEPSQLSTYAFLPADLPVLALLVH